jgi:ribosomal protein L29
MSSLYDTDIALWADQQAKLLRRRASNELGWQNVADEIEDVGKSEQREIESLLAELCTHLLKWRFQPKRRSRSWAGSITEARNQIARVIRNSPSLQNYPARLLAEAYADGSAEAIAIRIQSHRDAGLQYLILDPFQSPEKAIEALEFFAHEVQPLLD